MSLKRPIKSAQLSIAIWMGINPLSLSLRAVILAGSLLLIACNSSNEEKASSAQTLPDKVDFNFHIRPLLSDRCFKCHGPDEKAREAGLRLDLEKDAFAALDSLGESFALVPGDTENSLLVSRIKHQDPDELMPPPESNLSLNNYEIQLLEKWVAQGAEWKQHWAFIPPEKANFPEVSKPDWVLNPIDHFTLAAMESQNMAPNQSANKEKLLRRLSFDLRGLAPSLEEIDDFLNDDDPTAYEKWVDRFMSEESYGERMALEWLDLSRYADSHGYQDDIERSMWPWRDWVIKSFNENMPYDQFVSWQLAGDLIPEATYEQKLATGFNRNHKITQEVGVVDEEYRVEYVLDRVNTFSTAFLGLTVACAQCHDHKFDPISQKEFYSLYSFFNQIPEKGRVDYGVEVANPALPLPEEKVESMTRFIDELVDAQTKKLEEYTHNQGQAELPDLKSSSKLPEGLKAYFSLDFVNNQKIQEETGIHQAGNTERGPSPVQGKFSGALEFNSKNYVDLDKLNGINFNKPFSISFWLYNIHSGMRGPIIASINKNQKGRPGFQVFSTGDKQLGISLARDKNKNRLEVMTLEVLPENVWTQVTMTYNGKRNADGLNIFVNGEAWEKIVNRDSLRGTITPYKQLRLAKGAGGAGLISAQLDEVMIFDRQLSESEVKALQSYNPIAELSAKKDLNDNERKRLQHHYLHHFDPSFKDLAQRLKESRIKQSRMEDIILKPTMVMTDMDTSRKTFVLMRGQYNMPTEEVEMGTPAVLGDFPQNSPKNRLGLSDWLFDSNNPLTARVAVNRYWQMIFGRGIVTTAEDFGSQGDLPTHPELLDWLAVDFMESGWDLKRLIKMMVMSATYRQSTINEERKRALDPSNIYLARGPQNRLQAEMVRDHALAVSGLLSKQVGGPSVKPYHPEGLWLETSSGNQPLRQYIQDHDQDLYRKSMYTFWKRTVPPPSMITFDAPTREQCIVRRQSTNTPTQALVLLNDPQFVEASRLIAERMISEGGEDAESRIGFAFRLATSRFPNKQEIRLLKKILDTELDAFEAAPEKANQLLGVGEFPLNNEIDSTQLAAYTLVANAIINLTESMQKG